MPCPPSACVVSALTNLSNICGSACAGMPGPSSVTRSAISCGADDRHPPARGSRPACGQPRCRSRCRSPARPAWRPRAPEANRPARRPRCCCRAPRRRAALTTRSTISRRSIQSRRSSSAPASIRVIASRLRTISSRPSASCLICSEQVLLRRGIELVAIVDQAGRRAEDRRQRRAEIVRDRRQQRVAHPLGFGRGPGAHHVARERGALQRGGGLLGQRIEQRARFRIERRRRPPAWLRRSRRASCRRSAAARSTTARSAACRCRRRPARHG